MRIKFNKFGKGDDCVGYPSLRLHKSNKYLVLFRGKGDGIVLWVDDRYIKEIEVGDHIEGLDEGSFIYDKDYRVEISNGGVDLNCGVNNCLECKHCNLDVLLYGYVCNHPRKESVRIGNMGVDYFPGCDNHEKV